jgi:hypothetical protein
MTQRIERSKRGQRQREFKQKQLLVVAVIAAGVVLTANAVLESRGHGPLTELLLQPLRTIASLVR